MDQAVMDQAPGACIYDEQCKIYSPNSNCVNGRCVDGFVVDPNLPNVNRKFFFCYQTEVNYDLS